MYDKEVMYAIDGRPRRRGRSSYGLIVVGVLVIYVAWALFRPLPSLTPAAAQPLTRSAPASKLVWPAEQAAVGIVGSPILETHGPQTPVPTASTAKMITCLVVLDKKPLKLGRPGPTITLGPNDKAIFNNYFLHDGSLVPVVSGEQISQYQMLQTIMLPSANNMADSLAIWAFGSLDAYSKAANAYLKRHGITNTRVGKDASGLDPTTVSTAGDLVKIGQLAMANPVLAQIAGQKTASGIPVANTINNVNGLIGIDNIIGLKTGNSNEAGGAFVSASTTTVNNKKVVLVTAVVNAHDLVAAMKNSRPLIRSAQANFSAVTVTKPGDVIGYYDMPWGGSLPVSADKELKLSVWNGGKVTAKANLRTVPANAKPGQNAGAVVIPKSALNDRLSVPASLSGTPGRPSIWWRLTHPF